MNWIQKIKTFLFSHIGIIILALLVGLIYFLPNILIPRLLQADGDDTYHPLINREAPVLDEIVSYGAKVKEVVEGKLSDGDPYLAEYKNRPTIWGNYHLTLLVGTFFRIFGITDITPLFVWGDFIFPVLAVLLAFSVIYQLTRHKWWSATGAMMLIAFPNASAIVVIIKNIIHGNLTAVSFFSDLGVIFDDHFTRILVPSFAICFLLAAILAIIAFLKNPQKYAILAGIALGLLFYVYFYYWAFIGLAMFLLFIFFILTKQKQALLPLFKVGLIAIVLSIPYWINFYHLANDPSYAELKTHTGLVVSRAPYLGSIDNYIFIMAAIFIFWISYKRELISKVQASFFTILLLATILVLNIQIILGVNPQPDHWGSRINIYILVLILILGVFYFLKLIRRTGFIRYLSFIILPMMIFVALVFQVRYSILNRFEYGFFADIKPSLDWIKNNTPADAVVVTPIGKMSLDLAIYTNANIYMPHSDFTLAGGSEIKNRFFETLKIFNVTDAFFEQEIINTRLSPPKDFSSFYILGAKQIDPIHMIYGDSYKTIYGHDYYQGARNFPPEILRQLVVEYKAYPQPTGKTLETTYQADYVYYGPYERLVGKPDFTKFKNLKLVYNQNLVQIYKINHKL